MSTSSTTSAVQLCTWLVGVTAGFAYLASYEATPGRLASPPASWPTASQLTRAADQSTLIMFVHAHCPCTRASIGELERLMVYAKGRATVHVVLFDPGPVSGHPVATNLSDSARAVPGVHTTRDSERRECGLFGSVTSGQVLMYDAGGHLQFCGGLTASRGHAGDSDGRAALLALLHGRTTEVRETPVYGCSLTDCDCESTTTLLTR